MRLNDLEVALFVDLDGVLADFDAKVRALSGGKAPDEMGQPHMWAMLADTIIKPKGHRHDLLKKMDYSDNATESDLGFVKSQGTKQLHALVRQGFAVVGHGPNGNTYNLTQKGGKALDALNSGEVYKEGPDFYNSLDMMPDADNLWGFVKNQSPTILTGKPMGNWAEPQKRKWCHRELGPNVPVIVCFAREKAEKAAIHIGSPNDLNGAILIDDREKARMPWVNMGGTFILHTSADNTIAQLKGLGFNG